MVHICNIVKCSCKCEYCPYCHNGCPQCHKGKMVIINFSTSDMQEFKERADNNDLTNK